MVRNWIRFQHAIDENISRDRFAIRSRIEQTDFQTAGAGADFETSDGRGKAAAKSQLGAEQH